MIPMKIKSIRQAKGLRSKTVFLRSDFNVPIRNGKILDDFKIVAALPTIRFLVRHKCRVLIATHLGDPGTDKEKEFSTKPIAGRLEMMLGKKVGFVGSCAGEEVGRAAAGLPEGGILLLENLRYRPEEEKNNASFARELARPADIYVNNAFAVSHRRHASVSAIKKYLPSYAGMLVEKEIRSLEMVLKPKKPLTVVMGGAKISTKLPLLEKLSQVADHILLGGALANTFLYMLRHEVGKSMAERDEGLLGKIDKFYRKVGTKKIFLPIDVMTSSKKDGSGGISAKNVNNIGKGDFILDLGPKTINFYSKFIKKSSTIVWNGPLGFFENSRFKHATIAIGHIIAARSTGTAFGVAGGGETVEALKMTGMMDYVDWVSTGGGAMLSYLSGERMPGLEGLIK